MPFWNHAFCPATGTHQIDYRNIFQAKNQFRLQFFIFRHFSRRNIKLTSVIAQKKRLKHFSLFDGMTVTVEFWLFFWFFFYIFFLNFLSAFGSIFFPNFFLRAFFPEKSNFKNISHSMFHWLAWLLCEQCRIEFERGREQKKALQMKWKHNAKTIFGNQVAQSGFR